MSNASRGVKGRVSLLRQFRDSCAQGRGQTGLFLLTTGLLGLFRGTSGSHSSDAFPNLAVSRTVPEAGEDAGNCHLNDQLPGKSHRDSQRGYLNSQHMGFRPPKSGNCPPGMESC